MDTLIVQLIKKMGLQDEQGVFKKTTELVRLLELRSSQIPIQINEYGKIVLCVDIAATYLGIPIDKEQALKLSGLRKAHYKNNKSLFEKLFDINRIVGINDICIQLRITQISKKAEELLELYKKKIGINDGDNDDDDHFIHPQYAAMAVFQASKLSKLKIAKTKFMPFSNLRPTQWLLLEQRWDKFIETHYKDPLEKLKNLKITESIDDKIENTHTTTLKNETKKDKVEIEEYEKWKQRMLQMALKQLDKQKANECLGKENIMQT